MEPMELFPLQVHCTLISPACCIFGAVFQKRKEKVTFHCKSMGTHQKHIKVKGPISCTKAHQCERACSSVSLKRVSLCRPRRAFPLPL